VPPAVWDVKEVTGADQSFEAVEVSEPREPFVVGVFQFNLNVTHKIFYPASSLDIRQYYEESVVDKFKSNLLLMIFWLHIIDYNS